MGKESLSILAVDDSVSNITVLCEFLNEYDLITALEGESALEIAKNDDLDLILLDIVMPGIDGFEVCRRLKADEKTKDIPIIFLSSKDDLENIKKGFELGAVDYVTKPFNPLELKIRINNHLQLNSYKKDLEIRVKEEVEKNRIKDQIIFQSSKQAEIGELIGHISHQWKQPLSELANINIYNQTLFSMKEELDEKEKGKILTKFEQNSEIIQFMAETIDTFQNFYKPQKIDMIFKASEAIDKAMGLVKGTFEKRSIVVNIEKRDDVELFGKSNELAQVILIILNNAKDIFEQRKINDPLIDIKIFLDKDIPTIEIEDNGGGIDPKNINDIFLPFFSGKDSLGVGLYMSKMIVEKMGGVLSAKNTKNGGVFTIKL